MMRMSKLILLFTITVGFPVFSQSDEVSACSYCTSLEDALVEPKRVKHLDLSAKGLKEVPKELSQFPFLESLDLSENFIYEINFKSLRLPSLEQLNLSKNPGLNTFSIDGINRSLPELAHLDLSNTNCLTVSPELAKCVNLKSLNLQNNSIQYLPNQLESLDKLTHLYLGNNQLKQLAFLEGIWNLKVLDISGNKDLSLNQVGVFFLLKDPLENLIISCDDYLAKGVPNVFEALQMETLTIKNCAVEGLNNRLARNKALKSVVFDEVTVENSKRFVDWANRMRNMERIVFKNMETPTLLDEITSVKVMEFENCTVTKKSELKDVKPRIQIIAKGTDIVDGNYIGNAKIADVENSSVQAYSSEILMSDEMINNQLAPISKQREEVQFVSGDAKTMIRTENTIFDIPSEAFLTQSGQIYTGEVKVVVKEYMDPLENALTGMPMVFRTDERNEVFSSAGMLDFRAYDDKGNELAPNPENIIQVEMNDLQPSQNSNFYTFDETTNNWEEAQAPVSSGIAERKKRILDSLNRLSAGQVTGFQQVPIYLDLAHKRSRKDPYELSISVYKGRRTSLRKIKDFTPIIYTSNADQQWIARGKRWKIDTMITDETKNLLKSIKKDTKRSQKRWEAGRKMNYYGFPRVIKKLQLSPNIENDNYTMSFEYRDTVHRIPVVPSFQGSIRRIQAKERSNFKVFQKAQKEAQKERDLVEKYEKTVLEEYAKVYRERRAQELAEFPDQEAASREYLRFGLSSFGLVNCDYFSRNVPDKYLALDSVGVDRDGRTIRVPLDVRNVYLDDNVFLASTSNKVPVFEKKRTIIFFLIAPFEIAIVKGWEQLKSGLFRPKVERVPISSVDSPSDIKRKILAVGNE